MAKQVDERSEGEKKQWDELTELADQLIRSGMVDIYQQTKEGIKRKLDGEDEKDEDDDEKVASHAQGGVGKAVTFQEEAVVVGDKIPAMWEYRGGEDGQVHGPFTTAQILAWRAQGFFTGPTAVSMRQVKQEGEGPGGGGEKSKTSVEDLMADLDDDGEEEAGNGSGAGKGSKDADGASAWVSSDKIDFSLYC